VAALVAGAAVAACVREGANGLRLGGLCSLRGLGMCSSPDEARLYSLSVWCPACQWSVGRRLAVETFSFDK